MLIQNARNKKSLADFVLNIDCFFDKELILWVGKLAKNIIL